MPPDFLVIGAMKSGTTSLYRYLRDHPEIQMSTTKELHFFAEPEVWARGWEWYESQFPVRAAETVAMGEASTSYTKFPELGGVPARIAEHLPEVKLIYVLRHPVERMRSQYLHRIGEATESRPIDQALVEDSSYLHWSQYATQIQKYLEVFDRDRLLVLTSEHLKSDRRATLERVYGFLGADPTWTDPVQDEEFYRAEDKHGFGPTASRLAHYPRLRRLARRAPRWVKRAGLGSIDTSKGSLSPNIRATLASRLREDVTALRAFMPEDFDGWGIG